MSPFGCSRSEPEATRIRHRLILESKPCHTKRCPFLPGLSTCFPGCCRPPITSLRPIATVSPVGCSTRPSTLFHDEKNVLWEWRDELTLQLEKRRLKFHPGAHPRPTGEGVPFLGFQIFPKHVRLKRRKVVHFRRKLRTQIADLEAGRATPEDVAAAVRGWDGHARHGDTAGLRRQILEELPVEVRELLKS